jgi:hypothetical protein
VWKFVVILNDPSVHVMGNGARMPTVSAAFNLTLDLRMLLL